MTFLSPTSQNGPGLRELQEKAVRLDENCSLWSSLHTVYKQPTTFILPTLSCKMCLAIAFALGNPISSKVALFASIVRVYMVAEKYVSNWRATW